ncbi:Tubulin tyrosine ligase [Spironucleus salmonicida]|uniref:Tubulin tyrosine ligase n=1 Tax=Spironucleus salmonicida TaxID=348837 RepID=V6M7N1_9EUKA|nr:Tubulin tyrosine ligase [Spironucleus salmonicida]|eukprot:EST49479.1 Tubulin tyrosine ligase [Spironucleus salmonicida]
MQINDNQNEFKYLSLGLGNNAHLIKYIILTRPWWQVTEDSDIFNLRWQQYSPAPVFYNRLRPGIQIYSHLPNYNVLHSKILFYKLLTKNLGNDAFKFLMPTYMYQGNEKQKFIDHFLYIKDELDIDPEVEYSAPVEYQYTQKLTKNLWILKPVGLNRGRGIQVVSTLDEAEQHVNGLLLQTEKIKEIKTVEDITKACQNQPFLIQKYIENPLLIKNRKFDIRCFSLALDNGSCFVYKSGYLRLSGTEFSLDSTDAAIHLTNNAVQQYSKTYSVEEEGNMLSFEEFEIIIQDLKQISFLMEIWPKIQKIMAQTMQAASIKLIQSAQTKNCFELFGFDFMLDEDLQPYVIEVNSNPCIELSSAVSWNLIPYLLDDMFRITIDKYFPPPDEVKRIWLSKQSNLAQNRLTLDQWKNIQKQERQISGLKWQCLYGDQKRVAKNGFIQVVKKFQFMNNTK